MNSITLPNNLKKEQIFMLIIDCRESDSIDKALKKYKKKFEKSGTLKQIRARKAYIKPTVRRRTIKLKAAYRLKMANKYA